jgi:hypothetical protein
MKLFNNAKNLLKTPFIFSCTLIVATSNFALSQEAPFTTLSTPLLNLENERTATGSITRKAENSSEDIQIIGDFISRSPRISCPEGVKLTENARLIVNGQIFTSDECPLKE